MNHGVQSNYGSSQHFIKMITWTLIGPPFAMSLSCQKQEASFRCLPYGDMTASHHVHAVNFLLCHILEMFYSGFRWNQFKVSFTLWQGAVSCRKQPAQDGEELTLLLHFHCDYQNKTEKTSNLVMIHPCVVRIMKMFSSTAVHWAFRGWSINVHLCAICASAPDLLAVIM